MSTQIERSNATRSRILSVARSAFVRDGYDGASLERVAAEAGLTKGAVYHHYAGKAALFAAVFSDVSREVVDAAGRKTVGATSARDRLVAAAQGWLDAVDRYDARAILLEVGPQALGYARLRELEDEIVLTPLMALVGAVVDAEGLRDAAPPLLAARLINATLAEIALLRHATPEAAPSPAAVTRVVEGVIEGLLGRPPAPLTLP